MPPDPRRYLVLTWFCLAAMIAYIQRMAIAPAAGNIRESLELSVEQLGWVMSGYYWAYALAQIPGGWLGQRFGTRWVLPISVALSSLATAAVGLCATRFDLAAVWLLAGASIAGIFPCCVQSLVKWFPANQRAFPSGALGSAMSLGGAISTALTGGLLALHAQKGWPSWPMIFTAYGLLGLFWAATFPLWFRERPETTNDEVRPLLEPETRELTPLWLTDPRTLLICTQQFLRAAGYVFYATWFPTYLRETRGVSTAVAGVLTSPPLLGIVIGGAVGGWFIDWIERRTGSRRLSRQAVGVVSHSLCGLFVLAAYPIQDAKLAVAVITLGSLMFALGSACSYAITMDLGGPHTATLFAAMNTCGNIGAAICPVVVAALVPQIGWTGVLPVFSGLYFGVAICWLFLNPTPRKAHAC
jgi:ACS family D-galactonate transporter-like MFS transporter